jgi:hypothetical protein
MKIAYWSSIHSIKRQRATVEKVLLQGLDDVKAAQWKKAFAVDSPVTVTQCLGL